MNFNKNFLHRILTLLFIGYSTMHAMMNKQNVDIKANTIIKLKIFPSSTYSILNKDKINLEGIGPTANFIYALFKGFEATQVEIPKATLNFLLWDRCILYNKTYTPDSLAEALKKKAINTIPIPWLKKLKYKVSENAQLIVQFYNAKGFVCSVTKLPTDLGNRLLSYLSHDMTDKTRNCYDFFASLLFNTAIQKKLHQHVLLKPVFNGEFFSVPIEIKNQKDCLPINILEAKNEAALQPGDGIALYRSAKNNLIRRIEHCAIYLGYGIYISKCGKGGPFVIATMESMMTFWQCNGFYHIPYKAPKKI